MGAAATSQRGAVAGEKQSASDAATEGEAALRHFALDCRAIPFTQRRWAAQYDTAVSELSATKVDRDKFEKMSEDQRFKLQEWGVKVRCTPPVVISISVLHQLTGAKRVQMDIATAESAIQSELGFDEATRWEQDLLAKDDAIKALQTQVSSKSCCKMDSGDRHR